MIVLSEDPRRKNMEEQLKATSEIIWLTPPFYRRGNWGLEVSNDLLRSEGRWGWGRRFKINTLTSFTIPSPAGQVHWKPKGEGSLLRHRAGQRKAKNGSRKAERMNSSCITSIMKRALMNGGSAHSIDFSILLIITVSTCVWNSASAHVWCELFTWSADSTRCGWCTQASLIVISGPSRGLQSSAWGILA